MQFIAQSENKESGIRVEIELSWNLLSDYAGSIRVYENGTWKETHKCYDAKKAIDSYERMKKELDLTEVRKNEVGSVQEEISKHEEYMEAIKKYGK